MTAETTCAICMDDFKENDEITQLKCNKAHLFHTECIIGWIQQGKNSCPICRAPIENVEELRNMMEAMEGGEYDRLLPSSDNIQQRRDIQEIEEVVSASQQRPASQRSSVKSKQE